MTRAELAKKFNVSAKTLHNWENEKPELIRIINLGLMAEKQIKDTKEFLEKVENIETSSEKGKLII